MKRWIGLGLAVLLCFSWSCAGLEQKPESSKFILLSSTIGPVDAGIVEVLENAFEKDSGIRVRHVGAGTGAVLNIAQKGNVDLVMVHAKSLEEKFVKEGYGTQRIDFMYNDFVIVGPPTDPAGIKGWMTLAGVSESYGVPLEALYIMIGASPDLPADTEMKELEGLLPGMSVSTVRAGVAAYLDGSWSPADGPYGGE